MFLTLLAAVTLHWTAVTYPHPVSYLIEATTASETTYIQAGARTLDDGTLTQVVRPTEPTSYRIIAFANTWPGNCATTSPPSNCLGTPGSTCPPCEVCPACPPQTTCPQCPPPPSAPPYGEPMAGSFVVAARTGAINGKTLEAASLSSSTIVNVNLAAGTWYVWVRAFYPGAPGSNDANSFWLKLDAGADLKLGNSLDHFQVWHWGGDGTRERGAPVPLKLFVATAGAHKLTIRVREYTPTSAPRLDVLYLTQDATKPPSDAAALAALTPPTIQCP